MATYNSLVSRTEAAALIPEDVQRDIVQSMPQSSAVMRLARRLPNMSRAQQRIPVLAALAQAYFVTGDTGLKQTSDVSWDNVYLNAEELACIVPIPEKVLDDADYDIWAEIRPSIMEAMGQAFDLAVIHGTNAPASWPDDIVTASAAAGNTESLAAHTDVYDAVLGESGTMFNVEADGYDVTGHLGALSMKSRLRGLRDANGQPIFLSTLQESVRYALDGQPIEFATNGGIDPAAALLISGDWKHLVYSIRQDITFKLLTEATLVDGAGAIIYALAQQDLVALRAVMRVAWAVPNPINRIQGTAASRYPLGVLTP